MIVINEAKAIEITKDKLRAGRESEFKKNDVAIQNALVDGTDTTKLIARRDYLRGLPNQCDGKSLEELKAMLEELNAI